MKRLIIYAVVAAVFIATPAIAVPVYTVDLGDPDVLSDAGITLNGWGEAEPVPSTHGNYGGFGYTPPALPGDNYAAPTTPTWDHLCRMVWGNVEPAQYPDTQRSLHDWAEITFPTPIVSVTIRHLDGITVDSFDVYVDGELWGGYTDQGSTETWYEHTYTGTPGLTLRIQIPSTTAEWAYRYKAGSPGGWGMLGIDRVTAIPEPATICLLGIGALALLRKRRA